MRKLSLVIAALAVSACDVAAEADSPNGKGLCKSPAYPEIEVTLPMNPTIWRGTSGICMEGFVKNGEIFKVCQGFAWICEYENGKVFNEGGEELK